MSNEEAYIILNDFKNWHIWDTAEPEELAGALGVALSLLEKHRCGYCDCIMDNKGSKYGDYGRVCDNCYENLS